MGNNRNQTTSKNLNNIYGVDNERWNAFSDEQKEFYNNIRLQRDDLVGKMDIPNDCITSVNSALDRFALELTSTLDRYVTQPTH